MVKCLSLSWPRAREQYCNFIGKPKFKQAIKWWYRVDDAFAREHAIVVSILWDVVSLCLVLLTMNICCKIKNKQCANSSSLQKCYTGLLLCRYYKPLARISISRNQNKLELSNLSFFLFIKYQTVFCQSKIQKNIFITE